MKFIILDH